MECSRCKYKLSKEVLNYSKRWFDKPLCRNCQEWIRDNKNTDFIDFELANLPDYSNLINAIHNDIPNNEEYEYELQFNNEKTIKFKSNLKIEYTGCFRFNDKIFRVMGDDSLPIKCKEVPDYLFKPYPLHEKSVEILDYEARLIAFFQRRNIEIIPGSLDEEMFTHIILKCLEPYFEIRREVWGTHFSGRKVKIDAILKPKDNREWRNKDLVIGLEIKNPLLWHTNNRRDSDLLAQCVDYFMSKFSGVKDMIVLICPLPIKVKSFELLRFISRYNVGHLGFDDKKGIGFYYAGQYFWVEKREGRQGVGVITKSLMKQKVGNRGGKIAI